MKRALIAGAAAAAVLLLVLPSACGKKGQEAKESAPAAGGETAAPGKPAGGRAGAAGEKVRREAGKAVGALKAFSAREKDEYLQKMSGRLDALGRSIEELRSRVAAAQGQAARKLERKIKRLQRKEKAARQRLEKLRTVSNEKWNEIRSALDGLVQRLEKVLGQEAEPGGGRSGRRAARAGKKTP